MAHLTDEECLGTDAGGDYGHLLYAVSSTHSLKRARFAPTPSQATLMDTTSVQAFQRN